MKLKKQKVKTLDQFQLPILNAPRRNGTPIPTNSSHYYGVVGPCAARPDNLSPYFQQADLPLDSSSRRRGDVLLPYCSSFVSPSSQKSLPDIVPMQW